MANVFTTSGVWQLPFGNDLDGAAGAILGGWQLGVILKMADGPPTSVTVDGQTTAHYLCDRLAGTGVEVTELAHGVPVGGELDYLDDGTLGAALKARQPV